MKLSRALCASYIYIISPNDTYVKYFLSFTLFWDFYHFTGYFKLTNILRASSTTPAIKKSITVTTELQKNHMHDMWAERFHQESKHSYLFFTPIICMIPYLFLVPQYSNPPDSISKKPSFTSTSVGVSPHSSL